jgi:hypothetical protein
MSSQQQSYSRSEILAHPELLLRLLPNEGASILIEAKGETLHFIPRKEYSPNALAILEKAKRLAAESTLTREEAGQEFLKKRAEIIADIQCNTQNQTLLDH